MALGALTANRSAKWPPCQRGATFQQECHMQNSLSIRNGVHYSVQGPVESGCPPG